MSKSPCRMAHIIDSKVSSGALRLELLAQDRRLLELRFKIADFLHLLFRNTAIMTLRNGNHNHCHGDNCYPPS
ncbi:MAG: hypothetical protein ACKVJX_02710 [Verrucomicrobiia bacterium]